MESSQGTLLELEVLLQKVDVLLPYKHVSAL